MDDGTFSRTYDKIFADGRRDGYMDAVGVLWDLAHEAYKAGDRDREHMLHELAREIKNRFSAVQEVYGQRSRRSP